jgi:hypothetical protein
LVLVSVGILWVVVRNVIQGNAEQVSLGKLTLDLSIERIQISGNNLSITVKRNAGKGEFVGLSFVVEDGENSEVFTEYVSMNELDVKTFTFTLNQTNPDNIKKIKIVPIFRLKSGKEFVGEVKDTWEKSSSSGISQCTSNCPLGAECGSNGCLGGTCGTCSDPTPTCVNYRCVAQQTCTSNCTGRTCGSDGCEGNCGTCTNLHGTTSCVTGNCQPVCDLGYASCDLIASNGCETLLGTISNCANCSNSCLTGQNCTGGVCTTPSVGCGDGTCNGTETCSNCVPDCACLNGYTCQTNGTCTPTPSGTCGGVTCGSNEYCSNNVCLLQVSGNTYFVATNGSDSNNGTSIKWPWLTWDKAFYTANAGDIVYFGGGVYPMVRTDGYGIYYRPASGRGHSGTATNPIRYYNYPGETPILDGSNVVATYDIAGTIWNYGIRFYGVSHVHVKGITVRNIQQRPNMYDLCNGIRIDEGCEDFIIENSVVHNIGGPGFSIGKPINISVINCDAYDNCDYFHSSSPGGWGTGFTVGWEDVVDNATVYFYGCRAWNNSDQGFACSGSSNTLQIIDNCWAYDNGVIFPGNLGEGEGFKCGYLVNPAISPLQTELRNCISANNFGHGYTTNDNANYAGVDRYPRRINVFNFFSYKNGPKPSGLGSSSYGYVIFNTVQNDTEELKRVFRNNIAYRNNNGSLLIGVGAVYTHSNNSWDSPVTVADNDFVSLDVSQLSAPRKADGSLPDITFGHLAQGSDLIDAGFDVGLPYNGRPDIGAFETA